MCHQLIMFRFLRRAEMELYTWMGQGWETDKRRQGLNTWVAGVPGYLYQDLRHRERD